MSVRLTPTSQIHAEDPETASMANQTLAAMAGIAKAYGIEMEWNGCHDGQFIKPLALTQIAERIEQLNLFPEQLRWLAKEGGAVIG